jgi:hypothetical protein
MRDHRPAWKDILKALSMLPEYDKKKLDMQYCFMLGCSCMDQKEYRQMLEELKRDYDKKVEALNTVWEMYQNKGETTRTVSVADLMREAIDKLQEPFHLWQVRNQIETDHPEAKGRLKVNTISGHLTRMQRRGELEVVKKGYGTQPSSYKKKVQTMQS